MDCLAECRYFGHFEFEVYIHCCISIRGQRTLECLLGRILELRQVRESCSFNLSLVGSELGEDLLPGHVVDNEAGKVLVTHVRETAFNLLLEDVLLLVG